MEVEEEPSTSWGHMCAAHLPHGQHVVYVAAAELVQLLLQGCVLLRQLIVHGCQLRHLLLGLGRGGQVGSCL